MKRDFVVKGQSYIVNKVKTQCRKDLLMAVSIQYPDEDRYFKITQRSYSLLVTHTSCFCLKCGTSRWDFLSSYTNTSLLICIFQVCCCTVSPGHIYKFSVKTNHGVSFWGLMKYDNTPVKRDFGMDKGTLWAGIPTNVELSPNQRNDFTIPASGVNQIFPTRAVVHCHC